MSFYAYNPLAGGLLTGKHTSSFPGRGTAMHGSRLYDPLRRDWLALKEAERVEHWSRE